MATSNGQRNPVCPRHRLALGDGVPDGLFIRDAFVYSTGALQVRERLHVLDSEVQVTRSVVL